MREQPDAPLCARCNVETELVTTIQPVSHDPGLRVYACPKCSKHEIVELPPRLQRHRSEGQHVVGHVYGVIMQRAENDFKVADKYMYIQQIGVRKDFRGHGVGRALIAFIEGRAVASAVTGLQLDYWTFNTRAQSFFESCGFSSSQVMMRRTLSPQ